MLLESSPKEHLQQLHSVVKVNICSRCDWAAKVANNHTRCREGKGKTKEVQCTCVLARKRKRERICMYACVCERGRGRLRVCMYACVHMCLYAGARAFF